MSRSSRPARRLLCALGATGAAGAALAATAAVGAAHVFPPATAAPPISAHASNARAAAALTPSAYLAGHPITEPGIPPASRPIIVPTLNCPTGASQGTAER